MLKKKISHSLRINASLFLFLFLFTAFALTAFTSCKDEDTVDADNEVTTSPQSEDEDLPIAIESEDTENTTEIELPTGTEPESTETTQSSTTMKPAQTGSSASDDGKFYSYLTGLECTKEEQRKRPIAVMINNIKPALPNVGTSYADIMYECIVEGGQTRLMMVLSDYENVPVYGSVRSSRDYYIDLAQAHDAIYVHAGGTDMAYVQLRDRQINRLDGVNPVNGVTFPNTFYRDAERRKTMALEHTLMATGQGIVSGINQMKYRTTLKDGYNGTFNFYKTLTDMGTNGATANYVCIPYSNGFKPEFFYNADDGKYYRNQYGAPHIDGGNNQQLNFQNVIVIFADYTDLRMANGYLACNLTGTGYGFYISNGKYKIIKWSKDTRDSELRLFNLNNSDLFINQGKTFIGVTSTVYNKSVVINDDIRKP